MNFTPEDHVHTKTDFAINQIISNGKPLTQADLDRVYTVAQTEPSYVEYRSAGYERIRFAEGKARFIKDG